jgi:E3 ubiquitin-protein ligase RNF144
MGESSSADITHHIDDLYFSALSHGDETHDLIPISDESYAMELQLQEVLFSAVTGYTPPAKRTKKDGASSSSSLPSSISSSLSHSQLFCKICMDTVPANEVFQKNNACTHVFCCVCLSRYLGTKIRENISFVKCPEENCKAVLEPEVCQELLPPEVFKR